MAAAGVDEVVIEVAIVADSLLLMLHHWAEAVGKALEAALAAFLSCAWIRYRYHID